MMQQTLRSAPTIKKRAKSDYHADIANEVWSTQVCCIKWQSNFLLDHGHRSSLRSRCKSWLQCKRNKSSAQERRKSASSRGSKITNCASPSLLYLRFLDIPLLLHTYLSPHFVSFALLLSSHLPLIFHLFYPYFSLHFHCGHHLMLSALSDFLVVWTLMQHPYLR
jgi:hypothetical protein